MTILFQAMEKKIEIPPDQLSYSATGLTRNHKYSFRVGASTMVGDGETTHSVTAATLDRSMLTFRHSHFIRLF